MRLVLDREIGWLVGGVVGVLTLASLIGFWLSRNGRGGGFQATVKNLNARIRAWWVMVGIFLLAMSTGGVGSVALFGLVSWLALREFITLTPTRPGDHRALFWVFFIITPLQYYFVAIHWYGMFSLLIPVHAFLFIPIRVAATGDCERFLERTAKIQWALMVCVCFASATRQRC